MTLIKKQTFGTFISLGSTPVKSTNGKGIPVGRSPEQGPCDNKLSHQNQIKLNKIITGNKTSQDKIYGKGFCHIR